MNITIIGRGGHSKVIQEMVMDNKENKIAGYLDDKYSYLAFDNHQFVGPVSCADKIIKVYRELKFIVAIGHNALRKSIVQKLALEKDDYVTMIHRTAVISPSARIGKGTVIMANAVVNADAVIGDHCIINSGAVIEHDCAIGDFAHVSPNATLTGNVKLGEGTHIGAGAVVIPNMFVNEWSVIGAGAAVIDHIPSYSTAIGIPAKVKVNK
ncbi:MAG: acetyltransferase [Tuberibacillus sp.]